MAECKEITDYMGMPYEDIETAIKERLKDNDTQGKMEAMVSEIRKLQSVMAKLIDIMVDDKRLTEDQVLEILGECW